MSMAGSAKERRRYTRVESDFPVQLRHVQQYNPTQLHNSVSCDVSVGGMQVSSFYFYPIHCKMMVEVFTSEDKESIRGIGRIVWIEQLPYQERYKIGMEFFELSEDNKAQLRKTITNLVSA